MNPKYTIRVKKRLHNNYPQLEGGAFYSIDCVRNYELIRELCSYGKELLVLSPEIIKSEIVDRISAMNEKYSELRT